MRAHKIDPEMIRLVDDGRIKIMLADTESNRRMVLAILQAQEARVPLLVLPDLAAVHRVVEDFTPVEMTS